MYGQGIAEGASDGETLADSDGRPASWSHVQAPDTTRPQNSLGSGEVDAPQMWTYMEMGHTTNVG